MLRFRSRLRALGVVIVFLGSALSVQPAGADGIGDQQQQVKDDLARIDQLNQKASQLNEQYLGFLNQEAELDAEIVLAKQKVAQQQAELVVLEGQLANVAVDKFMGGGGGPLGPLFTDPGHIDDGLQRDELARAAVNAGAATSDNYADLLHQVDLQQKILEKKQKRAADLAKQANDASIQATQTGDAYQQELAKDQAKLGDLLVQEQQRQIDAAAAVHAKEVAAAQAKAAADAQARAAAAAGSTRPVAGPGSGSGAASPGRASAGAAPASDGGISVPPVSSRAEIAVSAARSQLGVPYKFAQSSPGVAFDCSGLTAYAWGVASVGIPHQSAQQYATTPHIPVTEVQPGDLLFFYSPISHVAIYIGNGQMIHAPAPGKFVMVANVNWADVVGASRPG